ncbi:MAG: 6,7-dimethyl-8-ribityllumazine synthase [Flavobacteriales bacterium]|jgi:6,7-dimethyl-8-ribityllumazine synthase
MATVNKNLSDYTKATMPNASDMRFGIVVSEWNEEITEALAIGATQAFIDNGCEAHNIIRVNVPGSYELVYGAKLMVEQLDLDAVVVIGSVVQGETKHFDFVCDAVTHGIKDLNVIQDTPIVFCLLTDNTWQQAKDRSGGKHGNKGIECAVAAIKMGALREALTQ